MLGDVWQTNLQRKPKDRGVLEGLESLRENIVQKEMGTLKQSRQVNSGLTTR